MLGFEQKAERNVVQMMVSLGVYVRRGQRTVRRWLMHPRLHALLQCVAYVTVGFLLPAASLGNHCQSMALGLICSLNGWPALLVAGGSMAGYTFFWGAAGTQGVIWVMMGVLAVVFLGGRQILLSTPLLMPSLTGLIVAATGVLMQLWQQDMTPVAIYLLRIVLAICTTGLFTAALNRRDPVVDWVVAALGVLALAQVTVTPYVGLGYIAAGMIACVGAFPAAALAGLALDLSQITPVPMTGVLSLAYMLRLLPWTKKQFCYGAPAAVYLLVMLLCGVTDLAPVAGLALGGIVAIFVQIKPDVSYRRGETGVAQVRLEMAAAVLEQTKTLLFDVEEMPVDEQALIARAAQRACGSCPCRNTCKEHPENIPVGVLHKPLGNGEDMPSGCRKPGRLTQELKRSQEQLRSIRADRDRREEYRWAVVQQYGFLSGYLRQLSDALAQRKNPPQLWYQPEVAVCSASRETANGDRCLWFAGVESRYYILLCDGMGTGPEAAREAKRVGDMLKKLLSAGYPAEHALRTVNSLCALQGQAGIVTIDLAELMLDTGRVSLYKWGAAPSYLIDRGEPIKIGTATPPPGLSVTDGLETVERLSLRRGETLVLLSDGAGREEDLRLSWERFGEPAGEMAARILESSRADGSDDATVAVVRLRSAPASP